MNNQATNTSFFDGGLLSYIGYLFLGSVLTLMTLGLLFPVALCLLYSWKINHTVIEGRRLKFIGNPWSLLLHSIKWTILTLITGGIYGFWVFIKIEQWKVKNTIFIS